MAAGQVHLHHLLSRRGSKGVEVTRQKCSGAGNVRRLFRVCYAAPMFSAPPTFEITPTRTQSATGAFPVPGDQALLPA